MRRIYIAVAALAASGASAGWAAATANASLIGADGNAAGQASFTQRSGGVWLDISASGLTPGLHGLHLHATGQCAAPDFASAGGHWNPMGRKHGIDSPQGAHMGDLPNMNVDAEGKGHVAALIDMATLDAGSMGMLDADGTAIVIHAGPDDNKTDPSGNSGGRILCGVVKAN